MASKKQQRSRKKRAVSHQGRVTVAPAPDTTPDTATDDATGQSQDLLKRPRRVAGTAALIGVIGNAFTAPSAADGATGNGPVGLLFLIMSVVGFGAWAWLRAKTRKGTVTTDISELGAAPVNPVPIRVIACVPWLGPRVKALHERSVQANRERHRRSAWVHVPLAVFGCWYVIYMFNFGYTRTFGLTPQAGDRFDQVMALVGVVAAAATLLARWAATRTLPTEGPVRRFLVWQAVLWVVSAAFALQVGAGMSMPFAEASGDEPAWVAPFHPVLVMRPAAVEVSDKLPESDHDFLLLATTPGSSRSFVYDRTASELREIDTALLSE